MRHILRTIACFSLAGGLLASLSGCGGEPAPAGCPEGDEIAGLCAGTPAAPVCDGDTCTAGVDCAETVTASDDAALSSAVASASAGTCIALAPGSYGAVSLPGGVSLLGKSAASVSIQAVSVAAGNGAVLRGLAVGSGGVQIHGAKGVHLESVRITGAASAGLDIDADSTVTVLTSTIEGGARDGLAIADGAMVTIEQSLLADNEGPGLWAECSTDCDCPSPPDVTVHDSILRGNHVGGIVLFGAKASLDQVDITGTLVGDDFAFGLGGGGISAAACSDLDAKRLHVSGSQAYGVLIDDSDALVGDPMGDPGVEITGNAIGVWLQHVSQSAPQIVTLDGVTLEDNAGVGLGADGDSVGLIVCRSAISGTTLSDLVVEGGDSQQVGDGLLWLGGSEIAIDGLALDGNARASIVIDGEAAGSLANVTLSGGDEAKGVLQQSYSGGQQPQAGAGAPAITTSADALFSIPLAPAVLPRDL